MKPYGAQPLSNRSPAVRQQAGEHVAAVERRHRHQVEEREQHVDLDGHEHQPGHARIADASAIPPRGTERDRGDDGLARLLIGPAAATSMKSRCGCPSRLMLTGTGFAQPMIGRLLKIAISGSRIVPIGSMWTIGFSDTRPSRRAVGSPEPVGGPGVRGLVNRQRSEHDGKGDEMRRSIQWAAVCQAGRSGNVEWYGKTLDTSRLIWLGPRAWPCYRGPKWASTASAHLAPTTRTSSSRVARRTPARLPNAVSSALRRRGPTPAISSSSDRRSRFVRDCRWKVTANRCASSRIRWISSSAGLSVASAIGVDVVAREQQLLLLRDPDRHQVRQPELLERLRTPPTAAPCRRRSGSGPGTARRSRGASDSGAARLRASRRSRC